MDKVYGEQASYEGELEFEHWVKSNDKDLFLTIPVKIRFRLGGSSSYSFEILDANLNDDVSALVKALDSKLYSEIDSEASNRAAQWVSEAIEEYNYQNQ